MTALVGNEILWVVPVQDNGQLGAILEQVTVQDIANLGGGGGLTSQITVSSGSTVSAPLGSIILFDSASGLPKTINAPTATGSLQIIEAADVFGDAGASHITFTPSSGSVVGGQNQVYTNFGSARWRDTSLGWINI